MVPGAGNSPFSFYCSFNGSDAALRFPAMTRTPKHILKYQAEAIDPVINAKRREIDERIARLAAEMGYAGSAETGYAPAA
jgi:hypothetical protein